MTEAKHTPGPWYVEVGNDPSAWANYFPKVVAENYIVVGTEGMYGDRETDLANARLISVAPDMIKELKNSTEMLENIMNNRDWGSIEEQILDNHAIIAKAAGK